MLIGISGTKCSGRTTVARYLTYQGFKHISLEPSILNIDHKFEDEDELVDFVTKNYSENFVLSHIDNPVLLGKLSKRPFFLHLSLESSILKRHQRRCSKAGDISLEEFVIDCDKYTFDHKLIEISNLADITVINNHESINQLYAHLSNVNLLNPTRLRPSWDAYFMRLADLAALRSNCMKRRVGCVVVRDNRIISTGYNGTPRNMPNCNQGGCARCNSGNSSGNGLSTCLCLHAEENALLEAGRDRISTNSILYCNTCPCLTCSIKIIQSGIQEVVYSQSYSMDTLSYQALNSAGVKLRQYSPPQGGVM
ncbi:BA75_01375T0 [Komagataella pastoris]|uniref:Deoxycytidylate deaminase n=1 Tax=Komagataella pastoris TaxID=4922 RepID=A0A1B2J6P9_PICPA|nr:BA75_01375T0 [Komagataella pastoris]